MKLLVTTLVLLAPLGLLGCESSDSRWANKASETCGDAGVAHVDAHDGQFVCKGADIEDAD